MGVGAVLPGSHRHMGVVETGAIPLGAVPFPLLSIGAVLPLAEVVAIDNHHRKTDSTYLSPALIVNLIFLTTEYLSWKEKNR